VGTLLRGFCEPYYSPYPEFRQDLELFLFLREGQEEQLEEASFCYCYSQCSREKRECSKGEGLIPSEICVMLHLRGARVR
jgi:hypothetical protein